MFKTVLVGADSSETARRAVSGAIELVKALGGQLHVVTAYDPEPMRVSAVPAEFRDNVKRPAEVLLDDLRQMIANEGIEAEYHPATGDAAEAIVRVADRVGADLVVVGNRGMKGVRRLLGSVPSSVAHKANCSVLILDTLGED